MFQARTTTNVDALLNLNLKIKSSTKEKNGGGELCIILEGCRTSAKKCQSAFTSKSSMGIIFYTVEPVKLSRNSKFGLPPVKTLTCPWKGK